MNKKTTKSALVITCYVVATLLLILGFYLVIDAIAYLNSYLTGYGMGIGDMLGDSIMYVVSSAVPYLVYAILVFCAGKSLDILQNMNRPQVEAEVAAVETVEVEEAAVEIVEAEEDTVEATDAEVEKEAEAEIKAEEL